MSNQPSSFTPRETVSELDKYIIGQQDAKRAVAVALRNRWRRQRVPESIRDEIAPKNIILIGSTGVGKTEIARRIAKLANAPFIKVEASKFTEVGYVGRDVDSMVRDLVETSVKIVEDEARTSVQTQADAQAEERVLDLLLPKAPSYEQSHSTSSEASSQTAPTESNETRQKFKAMLRQGALDERMVEVDNPNPSTPSMQVLTAGGLEDMGMQVQDLMSQVMGQFNRPKTKKMPVKQALELFAQEEASKLIDQDKVVQDALKRAQESGIIFLDEIDKIAKRSASGGPDVSREGVQRDILPIVEGSTVRTKYGMVKTDHILFIAAGAFHVAKVSDLIPELQGRFPIRVELQSLGEAELLRILSEPKNSLPNQYQALLATEGVRIEFTEDGKRALAKIAAEANQRSEDIGARRLHTVVEKVLEQLSFDAPELSEQSIAVDADYVQEKLGKTQHSEDLDRYIL